MRTHLLLSAALALAACRDDEPPADAYGTFEATATVVSAEAAGRLEYFPVDEGDRLAAGEYVALVDTTQLHLQRRQLEASVGTIPAKLQDVRAEVRVLADQRANLVRERDRVARLLERDAATPKQLDDLEGEIQVTDQRIEATRAQQDIANRGILAEKRPLLAQVDIIEERIRRSRVYNPVKGVVLTKLAERAEVVANGTPLYRIADLDTLTLRAYVSGGDLPRVTIGTAVTVLTDYAEGRLVEHPGRVTWVNDRAEFTPTNIQTREDRVDLVYAVKIAVPNPDGTLKIGMPAEVDLPGDDTTAVAEATEETTEYARR